jgi:hypothetical protein
VDPCTQTNRRAAAEVKVALLEKFPASVRLGDVPMALLLSPETHDKTRACAALRLHLEFLYDHSSACRVSCVCISCACVRACVCVCVMCVVCRVYVGIHR